MVDRTARFGVAVIRANLLPRPKETVSLLGAELDADYVRQMLIGLAIVVAVALIGLGIEHLRIHRLEAATLDQEAAIAADAPRRFEAKSLATEVARYQEFAREANLFRRSGSDAAIAVAHIGNQIPGSVWVDGIARTGDGYDLDGGARSVDAVSRAIIALGSALPGEGASLVGVENRGAASVHFSARVATLGPSPAPLPAATAVGANQ